jgi:hypothetical protein
MRIALWQNHHGVRVWVMSSSEAVRQVAQSKVFAGLDILAETSPKQLERIPILMLGVTVRPLSNRVAEWNAMFAVCQLDEHYVADSSATPVAIATVVIHELTHARLDRAGISVTGTNRGRMERICRLAERNFLLRLPSSAERTRLLATNARWLAIDPSSLLEVLAYTRRNMDGKPDDHRIRDKLIRLLGRPSSPSAT